MMRYRSVLTGAAVALLTLAGYAIEGTGVAAAAARSYVPISGAGSQFASVALEMWAENLASKGITVDYNPDGSDAGRADFIAAQVDFAASDSPFRTVRDKLSGAARQVVPYDYSYIPDVASGIAVLYHVSVGGHLVRDLKLSEPTIAKIFTGQITNWDNPAITRDNGTALPNLPIVPVIDADGSGASYYFTNWMSREFPRLWDGFCDRVKRGIKAPCGQTEFYPKFGRAMRKAGPSEVAAFIASARGNGTIGFAEAAYATPAKAQVARVRNPAGRYVLPTAHNVTVALTQASIDENPHSASYLQENLNKVYAYDNPDSYPLSAYSYLIVPRSGPHRLPNFSNADGRTLSTFAVYLLCHGQREATAAGYAPLPSNLIMGGLKQVSAIPGHVAVPKAGSCG